MRVVGVCVHMSTKGRPAAHIVDADGSWGAVTDTQSFELTSNKQDLATILYELASGLRSHLAGVRADRVVIRRADYFKISSRHEGPRLRLLAEGALAGAARGEVEDVLVLTGKELADRSRATSKDNLEAEAARQMPGCPREAATAALSGLEP
jgi:hypothetical protein